MKIGRLVLFGAMILPGLGIAEPAPAQQARSAEFRTQADAMLAAAYPADQPGAAAVVMRRGRVIYRAGRGLANIEARRPITPHTVFRLGSITKQFTAAVILQLVQEGRISLEDPVSRFYPDYPQPGARATVRQLLSHTSGIRSYTTVREWTVPENFSRAHTTDEMIAISRDRPSPTRPGEVFQYNNSGYVLLGGIIERVTGMPWHQAVVERIARPLGLDSIAYGESVRAGPRVARGYRAGAGAQQPAWTVHMSVPHAAGGLVGTVGDLARWAQALHHGRVVPPDLYREMIRPTPLPGGAARNYGFASRLEDVRGRPTIGHGGGIFGFVTESIYVPSEDLFVAVFANSEDPATRPELVARRLVALALGDPYPVFTRAANDPATLEPMFGVYRFAGNGPLLRFFARGGRFFTQGEGQAEMEAIPARGGRFYYDASLVWFELQRGPEGAAIMLMHRAEAREADRAVRIGPAPAGSAVER